MSWHCIFSMFIGGPRSCQLRGELDGNPLWRLYQWTYFVVWEISYRRLNHIDAQLCTQLPTKTWFTATSYQRLTHKDIFIYQADSALWSWRALCLRDRFLCGILAMRVMSPIVNTAGIVERTKRTIGAVWRIRTRSLLICQQSKCSTFHSFPLMMCIIW